MKTEMLVNGCDLKITYLMFGMSLLLGIDAQFWEAANDAVFASRRLG